MPEVIQEAFLPVNFISTLLLILVLLYWLMVIFGALDLGVFDIDVPEADADVDVDGDIGGGGFLSSILEFFYIGEVPAMIIVSIGVLSFWTISIIGNYYLNPTRSMLMALPVCAGNMVITILITKFTLRPFRAFFASLNNDENTIKDVIGQMCVVSTTQVSDKMGQAEVTSGGAPILINAITEDGCTLHKGDQAVVLSKNTKTGVYTIATVEMENLL
ncbi:MAG: DUF1449 family protein [Phycisphaerae bacterium]|nr:DUF1449 family protein [Phycisphaerae bacterium]